MHGSLNYYFLENTLIIVINNIIIDRVIMYIINNIIEMLKYCNYDTEII